MVLKENYRFENHTFNLYFCLLLVCSGILSYSTCTCKVSPSLKRNLQLAMSKMLLQSISVSVWGRDLVFPPQVINWCQCHRSHPQRMKDYSQGSRGSRAARPLHHLRIHQIKNWIRNLISFSPLMFLYIHLNSVCLFVHSRAGRY